MRSLGVDARIGLLKKRVDRLRRLHVRAVIVEVPNRNMPGELGHPAVMIAMPMRRDQVVDLCESGVLDGIHDPSRVPRRSRTTVTSVDQDGFARRRYEKRRAAALHVDEI